MTYTLTETPDVIVRDEDQALIPNDPDNVDYQEYLAWLDEGNEPTPYSPPPPSKAQEAAAWLAGGLTVNFTSGAAPLSGRYGVVEPYSHNINAISTSMAFDGNAFPNNAPSVALSDLDGNVKEFDKNSFKLLTRAIRDFVHNTNLYVMEQAASLPDNITSKSISELDA